ncbi:MAG: hypothetical protein ACR5LG_02465 [Sodalis sp. (in: enterobacteria)]|uniref:hypothetical protein n=1 Tax=Sodalis sp. (in: enterobacteria) TaxID=1898979 RepID=UPI003F37353C
MADLIAHIDQRIRRALGGRPRHSVVIATEHSTYRLQGLANGEVARFVGDIEHQSGITQRRGGSQRHPTKWTQAPDTFRAV